MKMRLSVSSYSYLSYMEKTGATYFDICDLAKKTGFEAIEFIPLDLSFGQGQTTLQELATAISSHCRFIGLTICAYTVPADFLSGSGGDIQKEVAQLKECVDTAALLGAKLMRHDIARQLNEKCKSYRDVIRIAAPAIREVTEYAAIKGIRTCTENHGFLMQDAQRVEELILAVDHVNYGWLVDMGNFACVDQDCAWAVGIAAPYAFHVHAKDFLIKSGAEMDPGMGWFRSRSGNYLRGTVAGHGAIPIVQCRSILKKAGYDGFLSLEFEGMEENITAIEAGYAYLKRIVS
jgi:sugar phosphate isomerase/epimerase